MVIYLKELLHILVDSCRCVSKQICVQVSYNMYYKFCVVFNEDTLLHKTTCILELMFTFMMSVYI